MFHLISIRLLSFSICINQKLALLVSSYHNPSIRSNRTSKNYTYIPMVSCFSIVTIDSCSWSLFSCSSKHQSTTTSRSLYGVTGRSAFRLLFFIFVFKPNEGEMITSLLLSFFFLFDFRILKKISYQWWCFLLLESVSIKKENRDRFIFVLFV